MLTNKKIYSMTARVCAVALFCCLTFTGCETTEEIPITMTLSVTSINFEYAGGDGSFKIETNTNSWIVNSGTSWIKVSPAAGSGNGTVAIEVNANTSSSQRAADLTISGTGVPARKITVTQGPAPLSALDETWRAAIQSAMSANPTQSFSDALYKGQMSGGNRNGLGAMLFDTGDFYFGGWRNGNRDGNGIYIIRSFTNNMFFMNCDNAKIHVGDCTNNLFSGIGSCYDKTGTIIYDGEFKDDKPTETYPSTGNLTAYKFEVINYGAGAYYLGETMNGKCEGLGIFIWQSGDLWYGLWKNNIRDGYGIYITRNGLTQTGTWKDSTYTP